MAITKLKSHNKCSVEAIRGPFGNHYGKLVCKRHKKWIQWLNQHDYDAIIQHDVHCVGFDGVKERPSRRPIQQEFKMQKKDGRIWNNMYSWQG